jgi:dephospho-CoA kinase
VIKVGLTGGYASGKSFVAEELQRLGCHLIYADRLGHEVLLPGAEAYAPAVKAFGPGILDETGVIDRKKLGKLVFSSDELLAQLSAIVHPAVFRLEEQLLSQLESTDPNGVAVVEAAILIETGRYQFYEKLVVVVCDQETQIARACKRDGLTREEVLARLEKQLPAEEKVKYADYVVDTTGSKADTAGQVRQLYYSLLEPAENDAK